jgi:hypothetical protein
MSVALCLSAVLTEPTKNSDEWLLLLGKHNKSESGGTIERGTGCIKCSNSLIDFVSLRSIQFYLFIWVLLNDCLNDWLRLLNLSNGLTGRLATWNRLIEIVRPSRCVRLADWLIPTEFLKLTSWLNVTDWLSYWDHIISEKWIEADWLNHWQ